MGTWESDASLYDVTLSDVVFNLWWVEDPNDENYEANLELRWTIFLDGQQIFQYEDNEDAATLQGFAQPRVELHRSSRKSIKWRNSPKSSPSSDSTRAASRLA